ncbi:phage holin family protein [Nocardia sp. AG03]|uniref:phage holin family protein n=1 Tax=Nocardia sp. AG03 TaxID=3025312 RepID=UPI00241825FD|nr:phage holin family protein [Nocardia sp. AG03]
MADTRTGPPTTHDRSVSELVGDASQQITRLVRDEIQLARIEMQDRTKGLALGAGIAGAGGLLAFYGGIALTAAAVFALALAVPDWAAALIVGAALLIVGGGLALFGKKKATDAAPPVPRDAVHGVKTDLDTIKEGVAR